MVAVAVVAVVSFVKKFSDSLFVPGFMPKKFEQRARDASGAEANGEACIKATAERRGDGPRQRPNGEATGQGNGRTVRRRAKERGDGKQRGDGVMGRRSMAVEVVTVAVAVAVA